MVSEIMRVTELTCILFIWLGEQVIYRMTEYEAGTFRCKDCGKEFLTRRDADKHYDEFHSNEVTRAIE